MNSFRPFQPKPGLKPTVRSIARLNDDDAPPFPFEREDELTFRGDDRAAGEMLLMLVEALRQFRAQNGASITIAGNTTIQQNICNILNNYRAAVSGGVSAELRALLTNINASFSAGNVTAEQADDMISRVTAQLGKIRVRPERRNASLSDISAELPRIAQQLKKNSDVKRRSILGGISGNTAPAQNTGWDGRWGVPALEFAFRALDVQTAQVTPAAQVAHGTQAAPERQGQNAPGRLEELRRELRGEMLAERSEHSERTQRTKRTELTQRVEYAEHGEYSQAAGLMSRRSTENAPSADLRSGSANAPADNSTVRAGGRVAAQSGAENPGEQFSRAEAPRRGNAGEMGETAGIPLREAVSWLSGSGTPGKQDLSGISARNGSTSFPELSEYSEFAESWSVMRREIFARLTVANVFAGANTAAANAVAGAFPGVVDIFAYGKPGSAAANSSLTLMGAPGPRDMIAPGQRRAAPTSVPGTELVYASLSEAAGASNAFSTAAAASAASAANVLKAVNIPNIANVPSAIGAPDFSTSNGRNGRGNADVSAHHGGAPDATAQPQEIPPHISLRQSLTGGVSPAKLRALKRGLLHIPGERGGAAENEFSTVFAFSTLKTWGKLSDGTGHAARTAPERLPHSERELLYAGAGVSGGEGVSAAARISFGSASAGIVRKSAAMQGVVLPRDAAVAIRGNTYKGAFPAVGTVDGAGTGAARYPGEAHSGSAGARKETLTGAYSGGIAELFRVISREGASNRITAAFNGDVRRAESAAGSSQNASFPEEAMVYAAAPAVPFQQVQSAKPTQPAKSIQPAQPDRTALIAGGAQSVPDSVASAAAARYSMPETARRTAFAGELLAALERHGFAAGHAAGKGALTGLGAAYRIAASLPARELHGKRRRREKRAAAQYGVKLEYSGGAAYFRGIPAGDKTVHAAQGAPAAQNQARQPFKSSTPRAKEPGALLTKKSGGKSESARMTPAESMGMPAVSAFIRMHNTYSVSAVFPGGRSPAGTAGAESSRLALPAARPLVQRVLNYLTADSAAEAAAHGFPAGRDEYPGHTGNDTRGIAHDNAGQTPGRGGVPAAGLPAEMTLHGKQTASVTPPRTRGSVKLLYTSARLNDIVTHANALIEPRGGHSTADSPALSPDVVMLRPAGQTDGARLTAIYDRRSTALFYSETGRAAEAALPTAGSTYGESVSVYAMGGGAPAEEDGGLVLAALPVRRGGEPDPEKTPEAEETPAAQPGGTPQEPPAITTAPPDEKRLTELIRSTVDDVTTRREYVELLRKSVFSPESTERLCGLVMERLENRLRTESRISGR